MALGETVAHRETTFGGVTILDLEQEPIAFFPNPIDVVQFYIPRMALEEFAYENRIAIAQTLTRPHCEMDATPKHLGMAILSAIQRSGPAPKRFLDYIGQTILAHATCVYGGVPTSSGLAPGHLAPLAGATRKEVPQREPV